MVLEFKHRIDPEPWSSKAANVTHCTIMPRNLLFNLIYSKMFLIPSVVCILFGFLSVLQIANGLILFKTQNPTAEPSLKAYNVVKWRTDPKTNPD